ncbi:MAG: MarR family transcriptional regulator [Spirochaetaceae bacterium]|jgi:MarR family 2-MHQ and catechol resistance regulon transcriptional repressor|nr:MarR family transcriptional regulator [Spirochaetaceae bacterium]
MNRNYRDYGEENNRNLRLVIGFSRSIIEFERSTQQMLSQFNITLPQFGVLEALYHLGDMKICEIIKKTLSTSGNMTVLIKNLEKESFVLKKQSLDDKRASLICLTKKGINLIEKLFPKNLDLLSQKFCRLSGNEKDELSKLIKKMNGLK